MFYFFFHYSTTGLGTYSLIFRSFNFNAASTGTTHSTFQQVLLFFWLSRGLVVWPGLDDLFVPRNPRKVHASHCLGRIMGFAYTVCPHGEISISCTIHNESHSPSSCTKNYTFLRSFSAFSYYVWDRFLSISISATLLCLNYFYFDINCFYRWSFCYNQKRFSFSLKISFSSQYPSLSCEISLACCLKCLSQNTRDVTSLVKAHELCFCLH